MCDRMSLKNPKEILEYSQKELIAHIKRAEARVKTQRKLVDIPNQRILVVGDIHGDLIQVERALYLLKMKEVDVVIFDGDLIDRGPEMIECVGLVMQALVDYPNQVYYLRGNHELESINSVYGFRGFVTQFFGYAGYQQFQHFFEQLPLAAKIGQHAFVTHGGIPNETIFFHMMRLDLKVKEPKAGSMDWQLIWNDPDGRVKDFMHSHRGEGCYKFGKKPFAEFLEFHNLDLVIRAHSVHKRGYKWYFDHQLLSIFSSKAGPYKLVNPHFALLEKDQSVTLLPTKDVF